MKNNKELKAVITTEETKPDTTITFEDRFEFIGHLANEFGYAHGYLEKASRRNKLTEKGKKIYAAFEEIRFLLDDILESEGYDSSDALSEIMIHTMEKFNKIYSFEDK